MTRMTGPDCAVMSNLVNRHTYIHAYILKIGFGFRASANNILVNRYRLLSGLPVIGIEIK